MQMTEKSNERPQSLPPEATERSFARRAKLSGATKRGSAEMAHGLGREPRNASEGVRIAGARRAAIRTSFARRAKLSGATKRGSAEMAHGLGREPRNASEGVRIAGARRAAIATSFVEGWTELTELDQLGLNRFFNSVNSVQTSESSGLKRNL